MHGQIFPAVQEPLEPPLEAGQFLYDLILQDKTCKEWNQTNHRPDSHGKALTGKPEM